jgi:hypothetical protein
VWRGGDDEGGGERSGGDCGAKDEWRCRGVNGSR